jgi:hypothetical protein
MPVLLLVPVAVLLVLVLLVVAQPGGAVLGLFQE